VEAAPSSPMAGPNSIVYGLEPLSAMVDADPAFHSQYELEHDLDETFEVQSPSARGDLEVGVDADVNMNGASDTRPGSSRATPAPASILKQPGTEPGKRKRVSFDDLFANNSQVTPEGLDSSSPAASTQQAVRKRKSAVGGAPSAKRNKSTPTPTRLSTAAQKNKATKTDLREHVEYLEARVKRVSVS
jgi:hypothetical protein